MFPLAAISGGISLIGGIEGILGGNRKQKEAEAAAEQAIQQLQAAGNQEYSDALGGGQKNLYGLTGTLNDSLQGMGRNLGAANAAAGVSNSSAVSGALAQQGAANAQTIGSYTSGLADTLARIRNNNDTNVARMRYGLATNNLNFAREQTAGAAGGLASGLGALGQYAFGGQNMGSMVGGGRGVLPNTTSIPATGAEGQEFFDPYKFTGQKNDIGGGNYGFYGGN